MEEGRKILRREPRDALELWGRRRRRRGERRTAPDGIVDSERRLHFCEDVGGEGFGGAHGEEPVEFFGDGHIMWGSDYPHPDSTWPFSKEVVDKDSAHLSPEMKKKVIHDNAAALYGLR